MRSPLDRSNTQAAASLGTPAVPPVAERGATKPRFDIYQHITDRIVAALENGAGGFKLPWRRASGSSLRPVNAKTAKPYRGVNVLTLWAEADARGYRAGLWATYRQWAEIGGFVRKGEKATFIIAYKEIEIEETDPETGLRETRSQFFARAIPVFAAEQVVGYTPALSTPAPAALASVEPRSKTAYPEVDAFVAATGACIRGGRRACYRPATDTIHMPPRGAFVGSPTSGPVDSYYATLLHELVHWTGHPSRCARQFGKRFGSHAYAIEELVAELGAAFLCADLGVTPGEPRPDHAQYTASWLRVLKGDKRAIFTAASQSSAAVAFLHGLQTVGGTSNAVAATEDAHTDLTESGLAAAPGLTSRTPHAYRRPERVRPSASVANSLQPT